MNTGNRAACSEVRKRISSLFVALNAFTFSESRIDLSLPYDTIWVLEEKELALFDQYPGCRTIGVVV